MELRWEVELMDSFEAIGHVRVTKHDKITGELVYDKTFKNQITNFARGQVALMWTGQIVEVPTMIAVGTGTNAAGTQPSDAALWAEFSGSRKNVDYAMTFLNYYTQYSVTYDQTQVLGTVDQVNNPTAQISVTEAGLFDSNGNLWSHVALNGVTHDNTTTLSIQWQILQKGN
jgi:hypothetical protein